MVPGRTVVFFPRHGESRDIVQNSGTNKDCSYSCVTSLEVLSRTTNVVPREEAESAAPMMNVSTSRKVEWGQCNEAAQAL